MSNDKTNWTEVQRLIDRFYEGATTQAEERLLMRVMCGNDVPAEMQTDAEVFRALAQEQQEALEVPALPADFEHRLMARIEDEEKREQLADLPIHSQSRHKPLTLPPRWWTAAAACLLAVLMLTPLLFNQNGSQADEFASSDISQAEAEQYAAYALSMVSSKMKAGMKELDEISRVQEQVRITLNDTFTE